MKGGQCREVEVEMDITPVVVNNGIGSSGLDKIFLIIESDRSAIFTHVRHCGATV